MEADGEEAEDESSGESAEVEEGSEEADSDEEGREEEEEEGSDYDEEEEEEAGLAYLQKSNLEVFNDLLDSFAPRFRTSNFVMVCDDLCCLCVGRRRRAGIQPCRRRW